MAGGGARGAGDRGAHLRALADREGEAVPPRVGHARPGLPRHRGETDQTNAAVKATASKVIQYGGKLITAYYYSSSGGRTANSADVFGFPVPYLVSKPDPWDRLSPHHKWAVDLDDSALAAKAGAAGRAIDAVASPDAVRPRQRAHRPDPRRREGDRRRRHPGRLRAPLHVPHRHRAPARQAEGHGRRPARPWR